MRASIILVSAAFACFAAARPLQNPTRTEIFAVASPSATQSSSISSASSPEALPLLLIDSLDKDENATYLVANTKSSDKLSTIEQETAATLVAHAANDSSLHPRSFRSWLNKIADNIAKGMRHRKCLAQYPPEFCPIKRDSTGLSEASPKSSVSAVEQPINDDNASSAIVGGD